MNNLALLSLSCCLILVSCAQVKRADKSLITKSAIEEPVKPTTTISIKGEITGKTILDDSLSFVTGEIDPKYYDTPIPSARITNNTFTVTTSISYPQMRRILFKSDRGIMIYRPGEYFIDASTSAITADHLAYECQTITGVTAAEYRNQFIPFFYAAGSTYDCHQPGFDEIAWDKNTRYDSTLYAYVNAHPASYVALWSLIERFSKFGHSQVREQTLARFSAAVQASRPWQILQEDLRAAPIKQGAVFPSFLVQGVAQPRQLLPLPKAQYTLVDFWFSRCRPCLESFPALKKLHATYQSKGFEIVSISTDRTADVPMWHKRIKDFALPWGQYLDENATVANQLAVYTFPTTFLLDNQGNVLLRGITPEELETFLAARFNK